jgi:hypothetical protein
MAILDEESYTLAQVFQILAILWFPQSVVIFLKFFQNVPLTMLLGTFSYSNMEKNCHQKFIFLNW